MDLTEAQQHLSAAIEAARHRDVRTYVLEIAASSALDGIIRGLTTNWPGVEPGVVEAITSEAVDALYEAVATEGRFVKSPGGYLWGTAQNMLRKRYRGGVIETVSFVEGKHDAAYDPRDANDTAEPDRAALRGIAIQRARALVPRLGGDNVVKIMTFILDCLEKEEVYISNAMIAEALGLTIETVRRSKSRAFQRLVREAQEEGIDIPDLVDPVEQDDDRNASEENE